MNEKNAAAIVDAVIQERRSVKPANMNGKPIDEATFREMLMSADWAPTHAHTEPWLFIIHGGASAKAFCLSHATLYQAVTAPEKFTVATYDKLRQMADGASHVVVAAMKKGDNPKIPLVEEIASAAAAIQNLLLAATARGIGSFWSTGGLTFHPAMKDMLKLSEQDQVLGLLYFGYSDQPVVPGKRIRPFEEKFIFS